MASFADRFSALGIDPFTAWMLQNQHSLSDTTPLPMIPTEGQSQAMMPFDPPRRMLAGAGDVPVIDATDIVLNAGPGGLGLGQPWSPTNPAIQADNGNGVDAINRALAVRGGGGMPGGALAYDAERPTTFDRPSEAPTPAPVRPSTTTTARMGPLERPNTLARNDLPTIPGEGGPGDFLRNNWLTLMALGGGIASGGIGEGLKQAASIGTLNNKLGTSDDIKEYQFAKGQGYSGSFADWMTAKRQAGAGKAGLNPIMDAEGNIFQLTTEGELIRPKGSENFKVNKGIELRDNGTHLVPFSKATGQVVGEPIPKNLFAAEAAKAEGSKYGGGLGEQGTKIFQNADAAVAATATLRKLQQLSPEAYSGAAAPALQTVRSAFSTFGIDPGKVPAGQEFEALARKMTLDLAGGSLGTGFSNADRDWLASTGPEVAQTAEGRMRIIENAIKVNQRKIEIARLANEYRRNPNLGNGSLDGFSVYAADWAETHPLFPNKPAAAPAAGGGTPPPPAGFKVR